MTDGNMFFSKNNITFDLLADIPQPAPHRVQFGPTAEFTLERFDIVKSKAVTVTSNNTSSKVTIVVIGREIV